MSSIGSGPGIGAGPLSEVNPARPVHSVGSGSSSEAPLGVAFGPNTGPAAPITVVAGMALSAAAGVAIPAPATLVASSAAAAGRPPVDVDRVLAIRKAIQSGNYPLVPTKISDAMIAAGLILRIQA